MKKIIGVDLNPENDRTVSASLSATGDDDLQIQVTPLLDLQVALTLKHVWEAFVDEEEDLPEVLADDVLGIKLDGSDSPTITIVNDGDETEMRWSNDLFKPQHDVRHHDWRGHVHGQHR